jgi:hypothetical protein
MRISLGFANSLARYDHVFASEAKQKKFVSSEWKGTKNSCGTLCVLYKMGIRCGKNFKEEFLPELLQRRGFDY